MGDAANALGERIAAVLAHRSRGAGDRVRRALAHAGASSRPPSSPWPRTLPVAGTRVGVLLRNRPAPGRVPARRAARRRVRRRDRPAARRRAHPRARSRRSSFPASPASRTISRGSSAPTSAATTLSRARRRGRRSRSRDAARRRIRPTRPGVAVQMLTSGTTGPPKRIDLAYEMLRRVLVGREALRVQPRREPAPARRRRGRQLAARPPGRPVPRPAVRQRRPLVRAARALHGRRLGRRRAPPSSGDGEPRAGRAAHGARGRRRPRRPEQRPLGDLGHGAARRPTTPMRSWPSTESRCSARTPRPSSAAASRAGTWPTTGSSGRRSAAASVARTRAASCASSIPTTAACSAPTRKGCSR